MVSPIAQIRGMQKRLNRAEQLVADNAVHPVLGVEGQYVVHTEHGYHLVNGSCTCEDAEYRQDIHRGWCKHRLAVELYKEALETKDRELAEDQASERAYLAQHDAEVAAQLSKETSYPGPLSEHEDEFNQDRQPFSNSTLDQQLKDIGL